MVVRWRAAALAAAMISLAAPSRAEDAIRLALGLRGNWASAAAEMANIGGFYKRNGLSVETLYTQGSGETLQAVISHSVDIGVGLGMHSVMGAFSKGAPIRVVGTVATGNSDLFWFVKSNSPLHSLKDARNPTTVGYSTAGSASYIVLLKLLELAGSDAIATRAGDVTANLTLVGSGQLDVGFASPPAGLDRISSGAIRVIARGSDAASMEDQSARTIVAFKDVAERRDVIARFIKSYREALDWMYDSPEALAAFSSYSGSPLDPVEQAKTEFYPKAMLDPYRITGLQSIMVDAIAFKFLAAPLSDAQLATLVQAPSP